MEKIVLPLTNGIGIYDKNKLCVSYIDYYGEKRIRGCSVKPYSKLFDSILLRGYIYFFLSLWLYFKVFMLQREEGDKNKPVSSAESLGFLSSYIMIIAGIIVAFLIGLLLLGVLPSFIFNQLFFSSSYYFRSFFIALLRFAIVYLLFIILKFCPFTKGLYSFNGAGNQLLSGKSENSRARAYPLNFLNFILNVFLISLFVVSLLAVNIHFIANFFINLVIILAIIPFCYEVLRATSLSKQPLFKTISLITNYLVCNKPNLTCQEIAMSVIIESSTFDSFEDFKKDRIPMSVLRAEMQMKLKGNEQAEESDIDWIIATILNKNRAEVKLIRYVTQKEYGEIARACEKRAKGQPISSIFGFVDFYGVRLDVNRKVLSPRMETELLVDEALKKIREQELKEVLDLCTGSGAIAIAIAKYYPCKVSAIDVSKGALSVAQNNAIKNGVKIDFILSDLFKGLKKNKKYDIIVSNPPYIKSGDIEKLDVEVKKYDPRIALDGGEDGLEFYRNIINGAPKHLNKKGWLFFEVGVNQAQTVKALLQEGGFDDIEIVKDYNKIERIVYGRISKRNITKDRKKQNKV